MSGERLKVGLGMFADYLVARAARRLDVVARKRRSMEGDYSPGPSYYDAWERAVLTGRLGGDDADRLAAAALRQSQGHRRRHYDALTEGWLGWLGAEPRRAVKVGQSVWSAGPVDVSVRPQLGLVRGDGQVDVLWLYLRAEPLPEDAAHAALRLLQKCMPDLCEGGRAVVVDVRRSRSFEPPSRWKKGFDGWIESEAAGLAALWEQGQAS